MIRNEMEMRNWPYQQQYRFEDCRDRYTLPFDFAVMDNGEVKFLIEFDGQMHYHPIEFYGGEDAYKDRVKKDQMKDVYCKINDLPFLRIPYYKQKEIPHLLDLFFYKRKST
ncbi:hypothetical protein SAMN04487944_11315 [Gracilibacillus ureilyticus]|uniref:DUF559 domain-containing protein n=2 Tax=Gracilibacillus ureilyticus TaxID=531814 RepID=A0A1H9T6Y0_9BACI|nr:hypothetical protein SAMN04487944_11315 [Gracilibacillus ureilyticus]